MNTELTPIILQIITIIIAGAACAIGIAVFIQGERERKNHKP